MCQLNYFSDDIRNMVLLLTGEIPLLMILERGRSFMPTLPTMITEKMKTNGKMLEMLRFLKVYGFRLPCIARYMAIWRFHNVECGWNALARF